MIVIFLQWGNVIDSICWKDFFFNEEISLTVFADRTATYEERLNKASLASLANKKFQGILILMYKVKLLLAPEHICNIFYGINIITCEVILLFHDMAS